MTAASLLTRPKLFGVARVRSWTPPSRSPVYEQSDMSIALNTFGQDGRF